MPYKNIEISNKAIKGQSQQTNHFYKGFSTIDPSKISPSLYDFELVKQDIINHFRTRKGERVMNPEFGSIIWDLLLEPMTERTKDSLKEDINRICNFDPRVIPVQIDLFELEQGYNLELTLSLVGTNQSSKIKLSFDQKIGLVVQ